MKLYTTRLKPNEDLRIGLLRFAKKQNILAGSIVTCVGSLDSATLRMAGATADNQQIETYSEPFEIVSLVGTIMNGYCHLHITLSKADGSVIGGHLKDGSLISTTAEVTIIEDRSVVFTREPDQKTGFGELAIHPRHEA
ncbi:DNA-binding protein [Candidatus Saccharibacteria bacterium]|nr:DNA-binding protein [Candidatus Saccharibacteria bacterium]